LSSTKPFKRVTLKDIAEKTGYSVTAVSHALKDMPDISQEAKNYIKNCADRLGYIGNSSASSLRTGRSKSVAVILGDLANPHFAFVAKEIEQHLSKSDYYTFIMSTNESKGDERKAITTAFDKNVDGIIICPSQNPEGTENIELLTRFNIPFVLIGRHFKDRKTNSVVPDDFKSGYLLGKHLLDMGHRKIAYFNTMYPNSSSRERKNGVLKAINESNKNVELNEFFFEQKNHQFEELFDDEKQLRFTAIIAYNDLIAWTIIKHLEHFDKSIPEDISLVGFDNLHTYLPLPFKLTSIAPQKHIMPQCAVNLLLKAIEAQNQSFSEQIVLDVELHDRKSVKKI